MSTLSEYYKGRDFLDKVNKLITSFQAKKKEYNGHYNADSYDKSKEAMYSNAIQRVMSLRLRWGKRKMKAL